MAKTDYNKVIEYQKYKFNVNVKLNYSAVRTLGGPQEHLVTVNDMGVTNYYKKYQCTAEDLQHQIVTAISHAKDWVDERENLSTTKEQELLTSLGFE